MAQRTDLGLLAWVAIILAASLGCEDDLGVTPDADADADSDSDSDSDSDTDTDADTDADTDSDSDSDTDTCVTDVDLDGYIDADCGGDDCNDDDESIHPGAPEAAEWTSEVIGNAVEATTPEHAFTLDADGNAHVFYRAPVEGLELGSYRYATNASGAWTSETLDEGRWVDVSFDILLDASGNVHIVYEHTPLDATELTVKYLSNVPGKWEGEVIEELGSFGRSVSAAIDDAGAVHVAYHGRSLCDGVPCGELGVRYATNARGGWFPEIVDDGARSGGGSLAIDTAGTVHITYVRGILQTVPDTPDAEPVVQHAWKDIDGAWATEHVADLYDAFLVDGAPYYVHNCCTTLMLGPTGEFGGTADTVFPGGALGLASNLSGAWLAAQIVEDKTRDFYFSSAAKESDGIIHATATAVVLDEKGIPHYDLLYTRGRGNEWTVEDELYSWAGSYGDTDIEVTSDGVAHVLYNNAVLEVVYMVREGLDDDVDQDCDGSNRL